MEYRAKFIQITKSKIYFTQKELNMRQRRWLELMKDYHPGKANIVADALRQKSNGTD